MIEFDRVTLTYPDAPKPTLRDVTVRVAEGELCLVAGRTGTGKSTLLGTVNGLVPRFTGGRLAGRVTVDGVDTKDHPPREFAHLVGVVGQDPLAGFVTDTVEEELAYGMEQLAVRPDVMRKRVEETLDLLGIADLRRRPLRSLSGGQQQRVAIGAVLTPQPRVLVLDEPTSALDPTAAEEVLAAITRLVHDLAVTVLVAEHRMERVVQYADTVAYLPGDGTVVHGEPATVLADAEVAPPVVELARVAGWSPPPLSVRDARRLAPHLTARLTGRPEPVRDTHRPDPAPPPTSPAPPAPAGPALTATGVVVGYGPLIAVRAVDLTVHPGEVVALMGRNGSGKSSLLWALRGAGPRRAGRVDVAGTDPAQVSPARAGRLVGLVPQTPGDLLYLETVAAECARADAETGAEPGSCRAVLNRIAPDVDAEHHPRDLSEGQRLALVLAVQLVTAPPVVLLDEPTRGLDYHAKRRFARVLADLTRMGRAVVLATHDVEFVAAVADRVVVLAEGEVVADGPTGHVIAASAAFAPQVAKILAPGPWLTVADVARALDQTGAIA